jgi:iron(III) transport system ATP-binding protein
VLKAKDISLQIGEHQIVSPLNLMIKEGEILGLVGKSGAGKTSVLKMMAGHLNMSSGEIYIDDKRQKHAAELLTPGFESVSYVSQDFLIDPYRKVEDALRMAMSDLTEKAKLEFIIELLELVDLTPQRFQQVLTLSGGEKQRLALVYAFAQEKEFLFLDEPFVHMDNAMRHHVLHYLQELKRLRNTGIVIVSHQADEILGCCDKVVYVKKGRIKRKSKPKYFYNSPKTQEEAEIFGIINILKIEGKRLMFRPNQYDFLKGGKKIQLEFVRSEFHGPFYYNYFKVKGNKKEITLFNLNSLEDTNYVYIK